MSREPSTTPRPESPSNAIPEQKEGKSEEIFEVEKVLSHKVDDNDLMLKVRWVGYGPEEDTWEPEGDLKECASEVVQEYYRKMKVNDKTELIEFLQKKIKMNKAKSQKRDRSESLSEDSDDSSSHTSKPPSKKQKRGRKSNNQTLNTSKQAKVPTKAALKSYEATLTAQVAPNNAKKAALEVRHHRREWLEDDSSDDEHDTPNPESEIEKIASKVKGKTVESPKKPEPSPVPKLSSPKKNGSSEPSTSQKTNPAPVAEPVKAAEKLWVVDGIVRHTDDKNVRKKLILMTNTKTGDRKILDSEEAFALDGWALTKYLLDRCEF